MILRKWKIVPGIFKDYITTSKRHGYKSLHPTIMHDQNMRVEIQIRSRTLHEQSESGLAAHWAYKQGGRGPAGQAGWIRVLIDTFEQPPDPYALLENTPLAIHQARTFALPPKRVITH